MKAAVIYQKGDMPQYAEVATPVPQSDDEVLVTVKAVAIKHFDKSKASGKHYSTTAATDGGDGLLPDNARVIGGDGVCILPDGTRAYGMGVSGMLAEQATIEKDRIVPIPATLDDATAAAMPNAVIGAAMGLRFKADIQPGDVVLINGATGFTGRVAVQIAKYYGAKRVIATGRNEASLQELLSLGADEVISVADETVFATQLAAIHKTMPIDVVIDYLWGRTAEIILSLLKGNGSFTNRVRFVSIGSMTGDLIQLSAANLRSVDLQLSGSGLGAWSKAQVRELFTNILPDMFRLAANGQLKIETVTVPLADIANLWDLEVPGGRRLVVTI
jgi:NADPH:quinone reductase-like Zn-dependent oxidoreductase